MQPGKQITASVTSWEYADARPGPHHSYVVPAILRQLGNVPAGAEVLDLGCGSGYLCGELLAKGFRLTGVDASDSGISVARELFPQGTFIVASATDAALPERLGSKFDAVVSME